tara:strand:+ start:231 stop:2222 length:1992 start_codon:yes stop_codon:yes gene_type:complete
MATYYKYAERSADSTINWAQVGQGMTDMLKEENRVREEKKAAIDEASREYGKTLQDLPSGDFQTANEFAIKFGGKAQEQLLIQDRLLKSGQLKPNDYAVLRQNLNDGTTQMFDLAKEYEAEYQDKLLRIDNADPANRSQQLEPALMARIEGLSNLANVDAVINPITGVVSIGKYVTKTIDGKKVKVLSNSPNDVATTGELRNRIKAKYDYFDVATATANAADGLGEVKTEMLVAAKRGGDLNRIYSLSDKKEGMYLTKAELAKLQNQLDNEEISQVEFDETMAANAYSGAEKLLIEEMLVNPFNITSILTENLSGTFTEEFDEEKAKAAHAKGDQSVIFYKITPTGLEPQPTEEQEKMAYDYLKTQVRSKISVSDEAKAAGARAFAPQPTDATNKNKNAIKIQKNLATIWKDIGTTTDPVARQNSIDAFIMAANQGKGPKDDKVTDVVFETDGSISFVHSDSDNNFSTTGPVGNDATAWMNLGTEVFGVMGADDMNTLLGGVTTIDPTGLRGMSSGRAGEPEFEETEKEAYIRYNKTEGPNAALFNTSQLVVNSESKTVTNVANMLTALGLDEKYEVDVDTSVVPGTDQIELINKKTGKEVAFLQLDEYNSKSFGDFRDLILSLGADQVEDLFSETYDYRTKQEKKVSSANNKDRTKYNKKKD